MDKTHLFSRLATCRHPRQSGKKHRLALLATILMLAFCMCPAENHAQYYYTFLEQGSYYLNNYTNIHLVANWTKYPDKYSVSVMPHNYSQRIRIINHNSFFDGSNDYTVITNFDSIPDGMVIKDIETSGNYAVICGSVLEESEQVGFIGYFDINQVILGITNSIHWYEIKSVTSVDELVVNNETGLLHVIAIGKKKVNNSVTYYVLENTNLTNSIYPANFNEKQLMGFETAYEIKSTKTYVAVIGSERLDNTLYIRRCRWSMGITDPSFDDIHRFIAPLSDCISRTHSTAMSGDDLAISYLSGEQNEFSVRLRVIDINTMYNTFSQEMPWDDKVEPKELIYMLGEGHLTILLDMNFPLSGTRNSLFIEINPYASNTYYADVSYFDGPVFYTLDRIGIQGNSFLALASGDIYATRFLTAPWPASNSSCPYKNSIVFNPIDRVSIDRITYPIINNLKHCVHHSQNITTTTQDSHTLCTNH